MNLAGTQALSEWQFAQIAALRREGWSRERIAARLDVSVRTIDRVREARHVCGHCGARFMYAGDLWLHIKDPS